MPHSATGAGEAGALLPWGPGRGAASRAHSCLGAGSAGRGQDGLTLVVGCLQALVDAGSQSARPPAAPPGPSSALLAIVSVEPANQMTMLGAQPT